MGQGIGVRFTTDDAPIQDDKLAFAGTLLGQIQRGRGAGFLRVLEEDRRTVHPLLLNCITHDPRWDTDVETRAEYYARLALATHLDLQSLQHYLRSTPDERLEFNVGLAVSMLGRLAYLGSSSAVDILRDYISYGVGWDAALNDLAKLNDPSAVEGLADVICSRFQTVEELESGSVYGVLAHDALTDLWRSWSRTHSGIARLLNEIEGIEGKRRNDHHKRMEGYGEKLSTLSDKRLLELANIQNHRQIEKILLSRLKQAKVKLFRDIFTEDNPFAWAIAFRCLAAMKRVAPYYERIRDRVVSYVDAGNETSIRGQKLRAIERVLCPMPAELVLPHARRWFEAEEWYLNRIGAEILENHATLEDVPRVQAGLTNALNTATPHTLDIYHACAALDILARFPDIGLLPEVEKAFVEAGYSFARIRAARAMQANAPTQFAETYAYECLWDCEEEARELGCESVALTLPGARERLSLLAADSRESELVRSAAQKRLMLQ